jgi:hypothetical protein
VDASDAPPSSLVDGVFSKAGSNLQTYTQKNTSYIGVDGAQFILFVKAALKSFQKKSLTSTWQSWIFNVLTASNTLLHSEEFIIFNDVRCWESLLQAFYVHLCTTL